MTTSTSRPSGGSLERAPLSVVDVALVVLGGTAGTGLRLLVSTVIPTWGSVPIATVAIKLIGAFLLGGLLEGLPPQSVRWSQRLRLTAGAGLLGGFTTYSALATDTVVLAGLHPARAAAYALTTVVLGGTLSLVGARSCRRLRSAGLQSPDSVQGPRP